MRRVATWHTRFVLPIQETPSPSLQRTAARKNILPFSSNAKFFISRNFFLRTSGGVPHLLPASVPSEAPLAIPTQLTAMTSLPLFQFACLGGRQPIALCAFRQSLRNSRSLLGQAIFLPGVGTTMRASLQTGLRYPRENRSVRPV